MAKLSDETKKAIEKADLSPLATASKSGLPNVIPIKFVIIENDEELWLVDNFMDKSRHNLENNPVAALNILLPDDNIAYQIKGTSTIETDGEDYQRMRDQVLSVKPDAPAKALIKLHVKEVYDCWPGPNIGKRLEQ